MVVVRVFLLNLLNDFNVILYTNFNYFNNYVCFLKSYKLITIFIISKFIINVIK